MKVEPLDATFGAVVTGVALADLDDDLFAEVHDAWLEHALLIFRGQHLTKDEQTALAMRFGDIELQTGPISNSPRARSTSATSVANPCPQVSRPRM